MIEYYSLKPRILLHIHNPPTPFELAVIARTLYVSLGPATWRIIVYGEYKPSFYRKAVLESRVPIGVFSRNVVLENKQGEPSEIKGILLLVSQKGTPIWELKDTLNCSDTVNIIVDYETDEKKYNAKKVYKVTALGTKMLAYEAAAIIHFISITLCRSTWFNTVGYRPAEPLKPWKPKLAYKIVERIARAFTDLDGYLVLEPNKLAYSLRKIFMKEGVVVEPAETTIIIDHVKGIAKQKLVLATFDTAKLQKKGILAIEVDNSYVVIRENGEIRAVLRLDPYCRKICLEEEGFCINLGEAKAVALDAEAIGAVFRWATSGGGEDGKTTSNLA